jgi:hypothetical protein
VTTQTLYFAWLILLSATEHNTQTIYSSRILTYYCQIFILILSSHQQFLFRNFNSTFPNTVALRSVNQTCKLHLSNDCKQAWIIVFMRNHATCCVSLKNNSYLLHPIISINLNFAVKNKG